MSVLTGLCPDSGCGKRLYFPSDVSSKIECTNCGQRHDKNLLLDVAPVTNPTAAIQSLLQSIIVKSMPEQYGKTSESVKVKGLSNYGCKLISPLLTKYGLDKNTQEVKLLKVMGQGDTFDCTHLADRAFRIEEKMLDISGYGRDSASEYLANTLTEIAKVNNNEECLVPIHADGDGHCLLHAVSRALVGHELFWHPLMTNLKAHLMKRKHDYKELLRDFFEESEWDNIIREADPNFIPSNGETHGLCNIHIFGLANVLHRSIILIDSLEGMQSKGDYSAVFVPALVPVEDCCNREKILHKPIIVSWSSKGRNHFVPLVGIKERPLPKFPRYLLPKLWGLPQELLFRYIAFENNACVIGGSKTLSDQYLAKLVSAMEKHFTILNGVTPAVVQDVYQHIIRPNDDAVGTSTQMVVEVAREVAKGERLYKCLLCRAVMELPNPCPKSWLEPGGKLYEIAKETHGSLKDGFHYKFPQNDNILCSYNKAQNKLLFVQDISAVKCKHCQGSLRMLKSDGSLIYFNGDQLSTLASEHSKCGCGFKHYWDGKEYDNLPRKIPVILEWSGRTEPDYVYWFQDEIDDSLNSNAFEAAQKVVQIHFPGEFGSERLVQRVVDQIFQVTLKDKPEEKKIPTVPMEQPVTPTKIILTGAKSKTLHKEELSASKSEKIVRKKIEHGAVVKQKRLSTSPIKQSIDQQPKKLAENIQTMQTERNVMSNTEKKVRISLANSRINEMFVLSECTTYGDIQNFITDKFDIPKEQQIIKYGFPPKPLNAPAECDKHLDLKHGERLTVHIKQVPKPEVAENAPMEIDILNATDSKGQESNETNNDVSENLDDFATQLSSLLQNIDLWEWACTQRSLFQQNGLLYRQSFKDLGLLMDNQHFSLPCFPNKLFAYNQREDEVFLCLGPTHIHVQPLSAEQSMIASQQHILSRQPPHEQIRFREQNETRTSSPFSAMHKRPSPSKSNLTVFSGVGHSMVENKATVDNIEVASNADDSTVIHEKSNEAAGSADDTQPEVAMSPVKLPLEQASSEPNVSHNSVSIDHGEEESLLVETTHCDDNEGITSKEMDITE